MVGISATSIRRVGQNLWFSISTKSKGFYERSPQGRGSLWWLDYAPFVCPPNVRFMNPVLPGFRPFPLEPLLGYHRLQDIVHLSRLPHPHRVHVIKVRKRAERPGFLLPLLRPQNHTVSVALSPFPVSSAPPATPSPTCKS